MTSRENETVRWDWTEDELWLIQMAVGFCTNRQMDFCDRISQKNYTKPDGTPFTEKQVHDAWVMYHRYVNVGNKVREQYQVKKKANEGRMDTKDTLIAGASEIKGEENGRIKDRGEGLSLPGRTEDAD